MLTFHIITLFPDSFASYLGESIIGRAIKEKKIKIKFYNPRDFVLAKNTLENKNSYKKVDDKPYGGGPGMVLQAGPILKAVEQARKSFKNKESKKYKIILFSPAGKQFNNQLAQTWANKYQDIVLICGRYEGVDARVKKILKAQEVSIGPYILTGGELPAMITIDTTARQIDGVLGKFASLEESRIASREVYTRPEVIKYKNKNYRAPKILISGHHAKIDEWRRNKKSLS